MKYALSIALLAGSLAQPAVAQTSKSKTKLKTAATQTVATTIAAPSTSTISTVVTTPEPTKKKKEISINLDTLFQAKTVEDDFMTSQKAGGILETQTEFKLARKLNVNLVAGAMLFSGNSTNYYTGEGASKSGVYVDEASANFNPSPSLTLSGGIVPTSFSPIASSYLPGGLPGASEKLSFDFAGVTTTLSANQVIPPTDAIKTTTNNASGSLMLVETLMLKAGDIEKLSTIEASASASHFMLSGMTSPTAHESRFYGSTVIGAEKNARFAYDFNGFEYGAALKARINKALKVSLKGSAIINNEAPSGSNSGYTASVGPTFTFGNFEIEPSYSQFRLESDAIPASYSNLNNGWANRQGQAVSLRAKLIEEDITFRASYNNALEIKDGPYQADRNTYSVSVETSYGIL